ncbi:MAG: hypothetical protein AAF526_01765 [Pseudomonadota bacterium]
MAAGGGIQRNSDTLVFTLDAAPPVCDVIVELGFWDGGVLAGAVSKVLVDASVGEGWGAYWVGNGPSRLIGLAALRHHPSIPLSRHHLT